MLVVDLKIRQEGKIKFNHAVQNPSCLHVCHLDHLRRCGRPNGDAVVDLSCTHVGSFKRQQELMTEGEKDLHFISFF